MFSLLKKSDFLFGFNVIDTLNVLMSYGFIYDNNKVNIEDLNLTYNSGYGKHFSCIGDAWLRFNGIIITIENKYSNENILSKVTAKTMNKEAIFIRISAYVLFIILLLITIPFEYYKNIFQVQNLLFLPIILFLIVIFLIRNKQDCLNINNKEFSKKYIVESLDTKQAEKFTKIMSEL
jgi:Mn2+/Fe2+ NRAMP family transporter